MYMYTCGTAISITVYHINLAIWVTEFPLLKANSQMRRLMRLQSFGMPSYIIRVFRCDRIFIMHNVFLVLT